MASAKVATRATGGKRCGVCRKPYRGKSTLVISGDPRARAKTSKVRACSTCAKRAILIVPVDNATVCACGAPATTCASCAAGKAPKDRAALVKEATKALRGRLTAMRDTALPEAENDVDRQENAVFREGQVDGLEMAIATLEGGRW